MLSCIYLNDEMIVPRQNHDSDEEELHNAYNELKDEASQVVVWLGKLLADYQSINRAEEIEKERKHCIGDLGGIPSRLDCVIPSRSEELELSIIRGSDKILCVICNIHEIL